MKRNVYVAIFFVLLVASYVPAGVVTHSIKKGESVSLVCLKFYGFYNDSLGKEILEMNHKLKKLSLVYPGYKLKLKTVETKVQRKEKSIFVSGGVVTYVSGDCFIKRAGVKKTLLVNEEIFPGDNVITGKNGRVELIVNCETVCRIGGNTSVEIKAFRNSSPESKKSEILLLAGTVWTKMKRFKDKVTRFQISMPNAVAGVHGTVYESSTSSDTSSDVRVFEGEVAVANGSAKSTVLSEPHEVQGPHEVSMMEWTRIVRKMQKIHIGNVQPNEPEFFKVEEPNEWESWNFERDGEIDSVLNK